MFDYFDKCSPIILHVFFNILSLRFHGVVGKSTNTIYVLFVAAGCTEFCEINTFYEILEPYMLKPEEREWACKVSSSTSFDTGIFLYFSILTNIPTSTQRVYNVGV